MIIVFDPNDGTILYSGTFDPALNVASNHDYLDVADGTIVLNKKVNTATRTLIDAPIIGLSWQKIRAIRFDLLKSTDWAVLPDSPLNETQVVLAQSYRQTLRDITDTFAAPDLVQWPAKPEFL